MALQKIDDTLSDLTDQCSNALVDQRALTAAQAVYQNLDLNPYKEMIHKEMEEKKRKKLQLSKSATKPLTTLTTYGRKTVKVTGLKINENKYYKDI